ncbi:MAG TPA: cupin domain-containing protein [Opitutus sp.]|nr:cupin domain-containing protein [Opitutus sp.]
MSPASLPASTRARELIAALQLEFLPGESGWFAPAGRSDLQVSIAGRTLAAHSRIFYLLTRELPLNYLHRLESDDTHVLVEGGPVDYFVFRADGRAERQTVGGNLAAGHTPMISVRAGDWKALRLAPEADYALIANILSPEWTADRVTIGAGRDFIARYRPAAPWATESFLRELIGPNER